MKKNICRLLAFIMMISACVINRNAATEVMAADVEFLYHNTRVINLGMSPVLTDNRLTKTPKNLNEVVFSWPTPKSASDDMYGGTYTLDYGYDIDGRFVKVDLEMFTDKMNITYQIMERTVDDTVVPPAATDTALQLFSLGAGATRPAIGLSYYKTDTGARTELNNVDNYAGFELVDQAGIPYDKTVKYTLTPDNNLVAFTLNTDSSLINETVKIYWNSDGRIYYSTNRANPSARIYDFTLNAAPRKPGVVLNKKTYHISTGYDSSDANQIKVYPSAQGGTPIDKTPTSSTPKGLWPGDTPQLNFEIRIPQKWDDFEKKFKKMEYDSDPTKNKRDNVNLSFRIDDVTIPRLNLLASAPATTDYKYTYTGGDFGTLEIYNRTPATIYQVYEFMLMANSSVSGGTYTVINSDTTPFGTFDVYTYLPYRIVMIDLDSYIIRITQPFRHFRDLNTGLNIYGEYRFFGHPNELTLTYETLKVGQGSYDTATEIPMSIPLTIHDVINPAYYYWVDFIPDKVVASEAVKTIVSQRVYYQQNEKLDTLQTPRELQMSNTVTVSATETGYEQDYARLKFSFTTGYDEVLENLAKKGVTQVDYYFYKDGSANFKVDDTSKEQHYMTLSLLLDKDRTKDPDKKIVYDMKLTLVGLKNPDPSANISLLSNWSYTTDNRTVNGKPMPFGVVNAEVNVPAAHIKDDASIEHFPPVLLYPSNYYAKIRGVYLVTGNAAPETTTLSNEVGFTVSAPVIYEVPSPISFKAAKPTADSSSSLDLSWNIPIPEVFKYMDYTMNPCKQTLDTPSLTYSILLGQNFENMKAYPNVPTGVTVREVAINTSAAGWNDEIDVSALETDALKNLRDGDLYVLTGLVQKDFTPENLTRKNSYLSYAIKLKGLDNNTAYYQTVRTELVPYATEWANDKKDGSGNNIIGVAKVDTTVPDNERHPVVIGGPLTPTVKSAFTNLTSITTTADTKEPSPDEFVPPAPTGLTGAKQSESVDVYWNRLQQSQLPDGIEPEKFEYEIIRVKANALSDSFLTNKGTLSEVLTSIKNNYAQMELAVWRTDLYSHAGTTSLDELTGNSTVREGDVTYNMTNTRNTLSDGSVQPGTMYVYYVRTIQKIDKTSTDDNNILKYSVWTRVSVTTDALNGPVHLAAVSIGSYDPLKEAYLTFDAPVPMADITSGAYTLSFSMKTDTGDWGSEKTIAAGSLTDGVTAVADPAGYFKYYYKVTGLESGSTYYFRVRITDNKTGDKSPWSNEIQYRTEFDPDTPEDESGKWIDYFRKKLEELLKKPYWTLQSNSETLFEAVYRDQMIEGVMGGAVDNVIVLGREGVREQIYYIPAKSFAKTVAAGKGFKIVSQNVTEIIPAGVIEAGSTQAVKDIIAQQNSSKIKDYYVRLSLVLSGTGEKINGNDALTDRITISVKTVGFEELEALWDADITSQLKLIINDENELSSYLSRIRNAVSNGNSNEDMVKLVDTLVAQVERDFDNEVRDSFNDNKQYEYEASQFAAPVRLVAVPKQQAGQTNISGYQLVQGQWQSITATPYSTGKSILPQTPGTFIFSGATVNIPGINEMQQGDAVTSVVIKYGLDDFFGKGQNFSTYIPLTNDALIGAVARMAGATSTQDAAQFLRDKGVTVSARNAYSPATNETAVYLLMSLYEIKTNTKVSAIRITNQNIVKDIPGIGANYVPYYKAAYHIGIMDKKYMPKEQMSVKDFLQILGKLAGKIKL